MALSSARRIANLYPESRTNRMVAGIEGKETMTCKSVFYAPATHGFLRIALCIPKVFLADPSANGILIAQLANKAGTKNANVIVFPELSLTGYSNDDLFFQDSLLDAAAEALFSLCSATAGIEAIVVFGVPLRAHGGLFNCAAAIFRGTILCVVPKTYLPNYREFYEKRYFLSAHRTDRKTIHLGGQDVPFGNDILLRASGGLDFSMHVEICEDLWVPLPPSTHAALAGAEILINLSASNATIGKSEYRKLLAASQSGRCLAAYAYCAAGYGESTTDLAWDGQALVYEDGEMLAENRRYSYDSSILLADIDLDRLRQERARMGSFLDCAAANSGVKIRTVAIEMAPNLEPSRLERRVERFPYIPADPTKLAERCAEIYAIQTQGLARRLEATQIKKVVMGISGGMDSAQALIVAAKAFDQLGYPRNGILGYEMRGFSTSEATRANARALMECLGVSIGEIDIRPSAMQMLRDIGHPYADGVAQYDVTFENVQAGERTSHLFRLANFHNALVVGTSDLSELALGYTTYGVGDHMSHYAVNASVPKTLIRHLLACCIRERTPDPDIAAALGAILRLPPSPELIPASPSGQIQNAETEVGPYALQDFFLYYFSRFGYRPSKIAFLALEAWGDAARGIWPEGVSERVSYDLSAIKGWMDVFIRRFFGTSQFKRSALPNGPKVGSGGSLSPRGDWRAPSDTGPDTWLQELQRNVP
jgi:NAD+ synthase (glutamine-hydrolysing)